MWNLIKKYWLSAFFCGVIACLGIMTVVTGGRTIAAKTVYAIRSDIKMNGINKNILYNAIASFEVNYDDNIAMKGELIEPLGAFNKAIGKRIVVDAEDRYTVYKMDNGQLTHNYIGYNITEYANNYVRLSQALKCPTAHYGRHQPHFDFGVSASPIVRIGTRRRFCAG